MSFERRGDILAASLSEAQVDAAAVTTAGAIAGWARCAIIFQLMVVGVLTAIAAGMRLLAQPGLPIYPDSYQLMLLTRGLTEALPVDATMGAGGDAWGTPFHRLGYSFIAWPVAVFTNDPFAPGLAISFAAGVAAVPVLYLALLSMYRRVDLAAIGAAALAISFSGVTWSRFAMSESLAIFLLALTLLMASLTRGRNATPVVTGIVAAVLVLVRVDLIVFVPAIAALIYINNTEPSEERHTAVRRFVGSWIVAFIAVGAFVGWAAQDVTENFTMNPAYLVDEIVFNPPHGIGGDSFDVPGLLIFLGAEPVLVLGSVLGTIVAARQRENRLMVLALASLPLVALYTFWNAPRHFAVLTPVMACLAAYGTYHSLRALIAVLRDKAPANAAAWSTAAAAIVVAVIVTQLALTTGEPYPEAAYEEDLARSLDQRLTMDDALDGAVICSYSPEAVYLVSGRPAKRLSEPDMSLCGDHVGTLVIADAPMRLNFGPAFERQIEGDAELLFTIDSDAAYLHGRDEYHDPEPARIYAR